jgi:hypothetical protein
MKLRNFLIPVLLSPLMLALASPLAHAYSGVYYVTPNSFPLRDCPGYECGKLLTAYQKDRVEILERTGTGWSKVRFMDRSGIGWIPSDLLSYSPDLRSRTGPPYYVNISSLVLRSFPDPNSVAITTLSFNEPVEMLGVGPSGWAQVRELRNNQVGWVPPRYLSSAPLKYPKESPRRRAPKAAPKEEAPEPPKAM